MGFASARAADQDDVALLSGEATAGKIIDERLVDWRSVERDDGDIFGERQFSDGELVIDRSGPLLVDLGVEQVADDALRFMLSLDSGRHDLVEDGLDAMELEFAHEVEDLSLFRQLVLRRWS